MERRLVFLSTLFMAFFLIISLSHQFMPMLKPELKKIHPELMELRSKKSQERVKVIVWLNDKESSESLDKIGRVKYQYRIIPAVAMEIPAKELENLAKESNVEKIVPDRKVSVFRLESMAIIRASNASSIFNVNGTGINISIIDTGIFNHTEFQNPNRIVKQKCYCTSCCPPDNLNESDNATDDNGHGTHVAGIAAGKGDGNGHGVATNASLFAVKVLDSSGYGYDSDVVAGIDWAVGNGSNIISLSLGVTFDQFSDCYEVTSSEAVDNATKQGVVVVVAAGNEGDYGNETISAPGCAKRVITVGATNDTDSIASFSSRGPTKDNRTKPDLVAPGVDITSTYLSDGYATANGTSQATPHVAGIAALLMQKFLQVHGYLPEPDRVKAILITAVNTTGMNASGYQQRNNFYGAGRIDAHEALRIMNFTKNNTVSAGEQHHYKINVTLNDLKTTLYWPEDKDTNNDLNLFVSKGSYNYSYPTHANDSVEQVFLTNATTGFWDVYVVGVSGTNQTYYLASNMEIFTDTTPPALILEKPENKTYTNQTNIPLNFTTDSTNHTIWYRLDGGSEVNITGNTTFDVSSDGSHYITLYVNDSYNNINQTTRYFTVDTTPPIITILSPANLTYTSTTIHFNITVDEALSNAYVSVDGESNQTMANDTLTHYYNISYPALGQGQHNVTFWVNDSFGHENSTVRYFSVDSIPPIITILSPSNTTYPNNTIWFNLTLNEMGNVTLVEISGTNHTLSNSSGNWNYLNDTLQDGSYPARFYANDSFGNVNSTVIYFSIDTTSPIISNSSVDKRLVLKNETINVTAVVTDAHLNSTWLNITWPDGNYTLKAMSNASSLYYYLFNDTNQTGVYGITIYANDTLGNEANSSLSFEVGQPVNVSSQVTNGTAAMSLTVKIFYNGTNQIRDQTTNTSFYFVLPSGLWDVFVNTSHLNITLFDTNLTQNITRQINISDDVKGNFIANVYAIKTVAAKFVNFSFSSASLSFDFNSSLVEDYPDLNVYRCSVWNFAVSNCSVSWVKDANDVTFNATIGASQVTLVSSNFSAFSLGEKQATTTTTVPATTSVSSTGGGGGTTTTTHTTSTTTVLTTTPTTTTSPSVTTLVTTTISTKEETTEVKTAWYLILVPIFAVIGFIVWFVFLRKPEEDEFKKLKEKWSRK